MSDSSNGKSFSTSVSNPSLFPHPVRPRGWSLYFNLSIWVIVAISMLGVGIFMLPTLHQTPQTLISVLIFIGVGSLAGYQLWLLYSPNVILYADRIEKRSLLGEWRALSRDQIRGVGRTIYSRNGSYFEIIPKSEFGSPVRLPASARTDPAVAAWLQGMHDPEAEILAADRAAVLSDVRYGTSEAERASNLSKAKALAIAFSVVSFGAALWIFISWTPYLLALGAPIAAPLLGWGLVRYANGLILWMGKTRARPQIGIAAAAPAVALGWATVFNNHLYDPWPAVAVAGLLGLIAGLVLFTKQQSAPEARGLAFLLGIAVGLGALGLAVTSDVALDRKKPKTFAVQVLDKHAYTGKSTRYVLTLAGWPGHTSRDVNLESNFFNSAPVGASVCISDHSGALGLSWFGVGFCGPGFFPTTPAIKSIPTDKSDTFYPERAQREGVQGSAMVECHVTDDLSLTDCHAISETPAGYGFGVAAVARLESSAFKLKAAPAGDSKIFRTRVRFMLEQ